MCVCKLADTQTDKQTHTQRQTHTEASAVGFTGAEIKGSDKPPYVSPRDGLESTVRCTVLLTSEPSFPTTQKALKLCNSSKIILLRSSLNT